VSEVNAWGGQSKQYAIQLDPTVLRRYGLTVHDVIERVADNNSNFGGGYIEHAEQQYTIRGLGRASGPADIENTVLFAHDGVPVLIRDVGAVATVPLLRYGATLRETQEVVSATAIALKGENGRAVIDRIKTRLAQIHLPDSYQLRAFYDQSQIIDGTIKMTSVSYPATYKGVGPVYTNSFDSMSRLTGLTDQNNNTDVSGVTYNAASQLLGISYLGANETRQYNSLMQLTQLTTTGTTSISYTYNYPSGTNNGQISSQVVSGETITYQYDSLKRLISATSSASWGDNYGYDAFGNLLSMTPTAGSPPQLSLGINPANNQIVGQTYDANGNELSAPAGGALTYDSENRLLTAPGVQYAYDSQNKRVWAGTLDANGNLTSQTAFVYGANGQMLGEYSLTFKNGSLRVNPTILTVYFGAKRIALTNSSGVTTAFSLDRLGSSGQYYPYGEGKGGNNPADTWSFATYWRDSATGLDYANQRYSSNQFGRFMTADPYSGSASSNAPQTLNRYTYVLGDPVNANDPTGLEGDPPPEPDPQPPGIPRPNQPIRPEGGTGPGIGTLPNYAKCNPNGSASMTQQLQFVAFHYADAANVANEADQSFAGLNAQNFNAADVLGWAAAESGYAPPIENQDSGLKSGNLDYFNLTAGSNWINQVACPKAANSYWACFGSFQGAAEAALFSPTPGSYQGVPNASAGYILGQQLGSGASLGSAFDAMNAATHFSKTANYGSGPTGVQAVTNSVSKALNCLQQAYGQF